MVIAAALALLLGGGSAPAAQACTAGSEFEPPVCPARLPAVRSVAITANGATAWSDADEPACSAFRLNARQVRQYLSTAGTVDPQAARHTLDVSPCYAAGTVRFADGSRGTWWIDRYRRGNLTRAGQPPMMLYCPQCLAKPFAS